MNTELMAGINNANSRAFAQQVIKQLKADNSTEARVTLYSSEIAQYLNPDNTVLRFSKQDSRFAGFGKTMTLPQAVANPSVTKGKFNAETKGNGDNSNVGTVTVRRNTNKTYDIEYFGTAPQVINLPEETELSYNHRQNLLEAHAEAILTEIVNYALIEWALDTAVIASTKAMILATGATRLSEVDDTTTVKGIAKNDLIDARAVLSAQNFKGGNFYALPTPKQYADLIKALDVNFLEGGNQEMIRKGVVGMIAGINVLQPRANDTWGGASVLYDTETTPGTATKQVLGATADGTTDAAAMMVWSDKAVWRAQGTPQVYSSLNDPLYKGDVYASEVRFGATRGRSDNKGVVMIIEDIQAGGQG